MSIHAKSRCTSILFILHHKYLQINESFYLESEASLILTLFFYYSSQSRPELPNNIALEV